MKEAIPFSQALRMRRICSSEDDFQKRTELKGHLIRQDYDTSKVQGQIDISQGEALTPRGWSTQNNKRTPLVVSYHPNLPHLTAITRESLPVLHASHRLQQTIPEPPIVAYRQPKTYETSWSVPNSNHPTVSRTSAAALVETDGASHASTFGLGKRLRVLPLASPSTYELHPPARRAMSSTSSSAGDARSSM